MLMVRQQTTVGIRRGLTTLGEVPVFQPWAEIQQRQSQGSSVFSLP